MTTRINEDLRLYVPTLHQKHSPLHEKAATLYDKTLVGLISQVNLKLNLKKKKEQAKADKFAAMNPAANSHLPAADTREDKKKKNGRSVGKFP